MLPGLAEPLGSTPKQLLLGVAGGQTDWAVEVLGCRLQVTFICLQA